MSQRPKPLFPTKFDKELVERIIHLHDVEQKGFRKIAEELETSKSTVHRIYKEKAVAFKEEAERELRKDQEYKTLREKEVEIQKEVKRLQAIEEARKNIKGLYLKKARTSQGIQDILSSPQKMLEFALATVDYKSLILKKPEVLESFMNYCQTHNLPLAQTLFKVAGSVEEYRADVDEDGILLDLDNRIGAQLDNFLMDIQEEERKKALQKRFEGNLLEAKCPECGRPLAQTFKYGKIVGKSFLMINGFLRCNNCNADLDMLCPSCKDRLHYIGGYDFHCSSCDLTFTMPHSEGKNVDLGIRMKTEWPKFKPREALKIDNQIH